MPKSGMFGYLVLLLIFFIFTGFLSGCLQSADGGVSMKVFSNDFKAGGMIPAIFTCDGNNTRPHIAWSGSPRETKSFAIVMSDPDAPSGTFYHWLIANIPSTESAISRGEMLPKGARQAKNSAGKEDYFGPCPPSGTHRYFFRVYALDTERISFNSKEELLAQIEKHKIAEGELMGLYSRKQIKD